MRKFAAIVAFLTMVGSASAGSYEVQVGYADDLRAATFFPSPWDGGAGVTFLGAPDGGYDSGAIRVINTSGASISLQDVKVYNFGDGITSYQIWGTSLPVSIAPGDSVILAQNSGENFDSSDNSNGGTPGSPSTAIPKVDITVDGTTTTYSDSGHVLDTQGFDVAVFGNGVDLVNPFNESEAWRDIGTFGGPAGIPEPASVILFAFGAFGAAGYGWRRRKAAAI